MPLADIGRLRLQTFREREGERETYLDQPGFGRSSTNHPDACIKEYMIPSVQ